MQVHSIISNTIPEEVLQTGHISIRFLSDGFSLLLEDSSFTPLVLNRFSSDTSFSMNHYVDQCTTYLENHSLLADFQGEVSLLTSSPSATAIPEDLFADNHLKLYLEQVTRIGSNETVQSRKVKDRPFYIVFTAADKLGELAGRFGGTVRILHPSECLISAVDQVNASDHQRGFLCIEIQSAAMELTAFRNDNLVLSNRFAITAERDILYHTLNTLQQLEFDRKQTPVFWAGNLGKSPGSMDSLKKYLGNLQALPYFIREINAEAIPENILLAEATKCG